MVNEIDEIIKRKTEELCRIRERRNRGGTIRGKISTPDFGDISNVVEDENSFHLELEVPGKIFHTPPARRPDNNAKNRVIYSERPIRSERMNLAELDEIDSIRRSMSWETERINSPKAITSPLSDHLLDVTQNNVKSHLNKEVSQEILDENISFEESPLESNAVENFVSDVIEFGKSIGEQNARNIIHRESTCSSVHAEEVLPPSKMAERNERLEAKLDEQIEAIRMLRKEKDEIVANQTQTEKNTNTLSSTIDKLNLQVSQLIAGKLDEPSKVDEKEILKEQIHHHQESIQQLEVDMRKLKHDTEMMENSRQLYQSETEAKFVSLTANKELVEEQADMQAKLIKHIQIDQQHLRNEISKMIELCNKKNKEFELIQEKLNSLLKEKDMELEVTHGKHSMVVLVVFFLFIFFFLFLGFTRAQLCALGYCGPKVV